MKRFSRLLLDNELSQHVDGVRQVVELVKKTGEMFGLRRKKKEDGNHQTKQPRGQITAILDTELFGFAKYIEL